MSVPNLNSHSSHLLKTYSDFNELDNAILNNNLEYNPVDKRFHSIKGSNSEVQLDASRVKNVYNSISLPSLINDLEQSVKIIHQYSALEACSSESEAVQILDKIQNLQKIVEKTTFDLADSKILKSNSEEYKKLTQQREELNNLTTKIQSIVAPITLLPEEILLNILDSVNTFEEFQNICLIDRKMNSLVHDPSIINKLCQKPIVGKSGKIIEFICRYSSDIKKLVFIDCDITDDDIQKLSQHCTQLISLTLNHSRITNKGLQSLSKLPLQTLDLSDNYKITDEGIAHLKGMPLIELNLSDCPELTDSALACLEGVPLKSLHLAGCSLITNEGLRYLKNIPLKELGIFKCPNITGIGLLNLNADTIEKLYLSSKKNSNIKNLYG